MRAHGRRGRRRAGGLPPWPAPRRHQAPAPRRPSSSSCIVVDQMRADYVDRFSSDWTGGLKRLVTRGRLVLERRLSVSDDVHVRRHATIATGAFPHTHGMFQNAWCDRERGGRSRARTIRTQTDIGYGGGATARRPPRATAHRLLVPTFADEMRRQRSARVVVAGAQGTQRHHARRARRRRGDLAQRRARRLGDLVGLRDRPGRRRQGVHRRQPDRRRLRQDLGRACCPPRATSGRTTAWAKRRREVDAPPSRTADEPERQGRRRRATTQWQDSPFADAYLGRFAAALVESMQLGRHEATDVLAISFSSPDLVGHAFGPRSQEVQDMYAHSIEPSARCSIASMRWSAATSTSSGSAPIMA